MRVRSLIFLANILLALSACVTAGQTRSQGAAPGPLAASAASTTALPAAPYGSGDYLTPASLNLYRLLPPPPEAGSAQERSELDELLRLQATRTPAESKRAYDDATVSVFRFADALGSPPTFNRQQLPLMSMLFDRIARDESLFMGAAKDDFARPRPFVTEPRLTPIVSKPFSASYPSGHTTWAVTCAIVLSDMIPERRAQIFARADEYGRNREVGGVHYPSDVAAGHLAGTALAAELFHSARFVADEAAATTELRRALGLPAQPPRPRYSH